MSETTAPSLQPGPSTVVEELERREQAEPLPSKRGEIGFVEGVHVQVQDNRHPETPLSARHPADRDHPPTPPTTNPPSSPETTNPSSPSNEPQPSSSSITKRPRFLGIFQPILWGGFHTSTVVLFLVQLSILGGTVVAWVFASQMIQRLGNNQQLPGGLSAAVFGHVVFVIAVIGQLVFLERRLFRLRGERYSYLYPGEVFPPHFSREGGGTALAFAPWNRPPLPTYAAALAQSGHGTGDVEDHIIAAPPPPAYGNTRGSRLLLTGFMRQSLLAQRPDSVHSQSSTMTGSNRRVSSRSGRSTSRDNNGGPAEAGHPISRPVSYTSTDQNWEVVQDADRARRLEETLERLENAGTGRRPIMTAQGLSGL